MREEDSNWFTKWEEELPSPEELIPLTQSLITPNLAVAFDLRSFNHRENKDSDQNQTPPQASSSAGEEQARTLKRPRLVWTPQLHKRFVDAVAHLGIENAVPKTIMQLMSVDGLTRENVASHLQKYRLYLKRMKIGGGCGGDGGGESNHLFARSHVPSHFLHPDHYMTSFVPITTLQHQNNPPPPPPPPLFLHREISAGKVMDQSLFLTRESQQQLVIRPASLLLHSQMTNYVDDLDSRDKKILTLFPTRDE